MKPIFIHPLCLFLIIPSIVLAQLRTGSSKKIVNFREGPGMHYNISSTIDHSNLLVILPGITKNGFVEVFDVESCKNGYVYESLIAPSDTLAPLEQKYFEKSGENTNGDVELILTNRTGKTLFFWINGLSYDLQPYEKKFLVLQEEEITYFSSTPGVFPIYGKEVLQKGFAYDFNFSL